MKGTRLGIDVLHRGYAEPLVMALGAGAAVALGILSMKAPAIAFVVPLLTLAALGLTVSPCYWALAAVVAAVCSRGVVALGLLPGYGAYLDLPLAWGAFAYAALTARSWSPTAHRIVLGIVGLAGVVTVSGLLAASSPVRWLLSYALLAAPFALVATILLAPPSPSLRRAFIATMLALAFIQVPISIVQAVQASHPDQVQGTFVGSDAGAHLVGATAAVAALWLIASARRGSQLLVVAPLLLVPLLSDAKQVIVALPAALVALVSSHPISQRVTFLRGSVLVASVAVLAAIPTLIDWSYSRTLVDRSLSGDSGKVRAIDSVEGELTTNPLNLLFGAGPAETVSHSALLLDPVSDPDSPLTQLDLEPSQLLLDLGGGGGSSIADPPSSALGVLGDLGLVGALSYFVLFGSLFVAACRLRTPEGAGASAALALLFILGITFTWWEQTGFTLYVAFFAGIALAGGRSRAKSEGWRP